MKDDGSGMEMIRFARYGQRLTNRTDVRLWVTLVRLAPPSDPRRRIGHQLSPYGSLWAYTQSLYERDAFQRTTDPTRFAGIASPAGSSVSIADPAWAWST